MSLPDGVTTCQVTYGPITDTFGNPAESITVEVVADRTIVHGPSGRTLFKNPVVATADGGGVAQVAAPHTDQSGFRDQQQNTLTGWYYVIRLTARFADGGIEVDSKTFQPLVGQVTVDADLLPSMGMVTPGVTTPTATVTSVAGQTGAVTDEQLIAALTPGLATTFASLNEDGDLVIDGVPVDVGSDLAGTTPVSARIDIVTAGKADIVSKITYLPATIAISGVPGVADYAGICQIRGRGNYTWMLDKKPYKLKLPAKVSLMGLPAFDDFALLANATDFSFINNALAFALGEEADGLDWTPGSQYAQTYLNGDYIGLYQLTETVKRGTARVNIDKAGITGLALTGGYMLEGDEDYVANGDPGFTTTQGVKVIYDDPDGAVTGQADYIRGKVQEFEDALFGASWLDPTTGYARFIDRDSFIDHYLIEELASNQEAAWHSSQKFYRTRDTATVPGRFFMGPLWDFDIAFGSVIGTPHPSTSIYARPGAKWITRMFDDPSFTAALTVRWQTMAARLLNTSTGYAAKIDALTARVAGAALADQDRWSYSADWATLAAFKKQWLSERIDFLTSEFVPPTEAPGATTGLTVGTVTNASVPLTWTKPTTGGSVKDYVVEYRTVGATPWTTFVDPVSPATAATVSGLTASTAYEFRVAATNPIGTGAYSNVVTATTLSAAAPGTFSDDFNRADSTSTLGSKWAVLESTWGIESNRAYCPGQNGSVKAVPTTIVNNYRAQVTKAIEPESDNGVSIIFRVQDATNYYMLTMSVNNGLILYKRTTSGGFETIGIPSNAPFAAGSTAAVEVQGSTIRAYIAGVQVGPDYTDATFASGTAGLRTDDNKVRFDDFSITPL